MALALYEAFAYAIAFGFTPSIELFYSMFRKNNSLVPVYIHGYAVIEWRDE